LLEEKVKRFIDEYNDEEFDVVVVGGGVTGAAVAYDAASRGLSVALVEKSDFGGETSSVTSKLIHGGLRYLATMEFGLVRESLRERKILENIAPNFVYPAPIMVTTNKTKLTNTKWVIKLGMIVYDIFSFDKGWTWDKSKKIPLHRSMSPKKVLEKEPNVLREGLTGASVYYDCASIAPERLTLAFIKSAVKYGAKVANYAKVEDFIISESGDSKKVTGVKVKDLINKKDAEVKGKLVINCGGPWADIILNLGNKNGSNEQLRRSEGIHVITKKLVNEYIVGSITPSGRHFFVIPWRNHSLIGTTDKEYIGSPDEYRVTKESIEELLDEVNTSFGNDEKIKYDDILYTYGGLRPLVEDQTEDVYESSRKYEIYDNKKDGLDGLITVEGGKYTTSRHLAASVVKKIRKKMQWKLGKMITKDQYLYGCEIEDMEKFVIDSKREHNDFGENSIDYLARHYGTESERVLEIARSKGSYAETLNGDGEMLAQVVYAIREEMACTLEDIMFRRTGLGTLGHPGEDVLMKIANLAAKELNWDSARQEKELSGVRKVLEIPVN